MLNDYLCLLILHHKAYDTVCFFMQPCIRPISCSQYNDNRQLIQIQAHMSLQLKCFTKFLDLNPDPKSRALSSQHSSSNQAGEAQSRCGLTAISQELLIARTIFHKSKFDSQDSCPLIYSYLSSLLLFTSLFFIVKEIHRFSLAGSLWILEPQAFQMYRKKNFAIQKLSNLWIKE